MRTLSPSEESHPKRSRSSGGVRPLAAVIISLVILASVGSALYWVLATERPSPPSVREDGPNLYQALSAVNQTVQNLSGGPWELFSYSGLAAEAPFSPTAVGLSGSNNLSLRYCGAALDGVTLWNVTGIPTFTGSIASGTAPFWQAEFYSKGTRSVVVATDVSGTPKVYLPLSPSNPCWLYAGGGEAPTYTGWNSPIPENSPTQARLAYSAIGESFQSGNGSLAELFVNGYTPLSAIGHGPNGGVEYIRCGLAQVAGVQPYALVGFYPSGEVQDVGQGLLTCNPGGIGPPATYDTYGIVEGSVASPALLRSGSDAILASFQAEDLGLPPNSSASYDAWGLLSWMIQPEVRNATGNNLPSTPLSCQRWVSNVSQCQPEGFGWSVVLETAYGMWLDTYPSTGNQSAWVTSIAPIVSEEKLVIIYPESWNLSGGVLNVSSTAGIPPVLGSLSL